MKQIFRQVFAVSLLPLLVLVVPSGLSAQLWEAGDVGEETFTFSLSAGVFSPSDYSDGSTYEADGIAFGFTFAWWAHQYGGLRAHGSRVQTVGKAGSVQSPHGGGVDPVQMLWGFDVVARYPNPVAISEAISWYPYAFAGFGGKSYRFEIYQPAQGGLYKNTQQAFQYGGGLEARLNSFGGIFGIVAEVRGASSDYVYYGYDESQSDLQFTAGITISY